MRDRGRDIPVLFSGAPYVQRLISLFGRSSVVEIWPLNETSGTVAYGVVNGYNGAYTGVDLANAASRVPGARAPYFDSTNDYVDIYSAGLAAAFNGNEGSLICLGDCDGNWNVASRKLVVLQADASNYIQIDQTATGTIRFLHNRVGNLVLVTTAAQVAAGWVGFAMTWSKTANQLNGYVDAVADGENPAAITTNSFTGAIAATTSVIGAASVTPANVFKGWLSYIVLLNRAATAAEIASANRILGGA